MYHFNHPVGSDLKDQEDKKIVVQEGEIWKVRNRSVQSFPLFSQAPI